MTRDMFFFGGAGFRMGSIPIETDDRSCGRGYMTSDLEDSTNVACDRPQLENQSARLGLR